MGHGGSLGVGFAAFVPFVLLLYRLYVSLQKGSISLTLVV